MANVLMHKGLYQRSSIFWGLCCCVIAGCPQTVEPQSDVAPPRVIEILPADPLLPVDGTLEVRFSEALLQQNVSTDSVVIVERSLVDETFIADLDNPPLIDSRQAKVETITVALVQENTTDV